MSTSFHAALWKQKKSPSAFTLIEMLIVIAIIGALAALLVPAASKGIEASRSAKCLSNLRQIGVAASAYSGENNGRLVPTNVAGANTAASKIWRGLLLPYLDGNGKVLVCPSDAFETHRTVDVATGNFGSQPTSYGVNTTYYYNINGMTLPVPGFHDYGDPNNPLDSPGRRLASVPHPAATLYIVDIGVPDNIAQPITQWTEKGRRPTQASFGYAAMPNRWSAGNYCVYPRHAGGRANALFYDGHARSVDIATELVANPIGDPECPYDYH